MRNALRRVLGRRTSLLAGLAAVVAAPLVFAGSAHAQGYVSAGATTVPGVPLVSFDISWVGVNPNTNFYTLSDRSNAAIDVMAIEANPTVNGLVPAFPNNFQGPAGGNNNLAGPNGNLTLSDPAGTAGLELWAGDGPSTNPACGGTTCSTVKVFTAAGGATPTHVISTSGVMRADELCWAPPNPGVRANGLVQIANDADSPPFISIIPTSGSLAYKVTGKMAFSFATNGIEQCVYDPATDTIFLNIPEVNGNGSDSTPGAIIEIDPTTFTIVAADELEDLGSICAGNQGMALGARTSLNPSPPPGSDGQLLLGCNAPAFNNAFGLAGTSNTVAVENVAPFDITNIYLNLGGNDQVYHTETPAIIPDGDWFLAGGSFLPVEQVAIISPFVTSGFESPSPALITLVPTGFPGGTTRRTHSIASWAGLAPPLGLLEAAIFPVPATGGGSPGFQSTLCTTAAARGCIAFYTQSPVTE